MDKIYYLDLQTVLDYLQGQSAMLSTSLEIPGIQGMCRGYIYLIEGNIRDCVIQSLDGVLLRKGNDAYALLSAKNEWQVRIDPGVERPTRPMQQQDVQQWNAYAPPPAAFAPTLRPIRPLEPHLLNGYTMKQCLVLRMVFAMVNGERTIEQIKAQLHLPPEVVDEALTNLYSIGVIT